MAVLAKSPFRSPRIPATALTINPATSTNSAVAPNPMPAIASAAASWNIWVNANRPQPTTGRNVTIGEVRSVLSGVDVSTITCTNLRDRIKVDLAPFCRTCWEPIVEAAMGHCGHLFCTECLIEEAFRERRCPLCMQALNAVDLNVIIGVSGATGEDS
ncbi:hypothetical protein TI39_contig426g00013 [Zymoseptoria brevis]|uniref:RING-type domain-containing protein n=1 Tax=Zymoseptoria brevis TaxID=1047168 RepID=A0A0F4GLF1_9PEZI|nr:hypothetical protein TI39_contig426g00013 [Zymoseptoria brevis]